MSENDEFWGAPIEVNGACPEWLRDDVKKGMMLDHTGWFSQYGKPSRWAWDFKPTAIRLPADHPFYTVQRHNAEHGTDFTYWPGGDEAPGDWDRGEVFLSNPVGVMPTVYRPDCQWSRDSGPWRHIIGYRKKQAEPVQHEPEAPITENIWRDFADELYDTARNMFQSAETIDEYREAFAYADLADEALRKAEKGEG